MTFVFLLKVRRASCCGLEPCNGSDELRPGMAAGFLPFYLAARFRQTRPQNFYGQWAILPGL
jgi:hypothetical protein